MQQNPEVTKHKTDKFDDINILSYGKNKHYIKLNKQKTWKYVCNSHRQGLFKKIHNDKSLRKPPKNLIEKNEQRTWTVQRKGNINVWKNGPSSQNNCCLTILCFHSRWMPVSPGASGMPPRDPGRPWRGTSASDTSLDEVYWPCSHSRAIPSFPSQLEWKIGLPWANTRGILNSPS